MNKITIITLFLSQLAASSLLASVSLQLNDVHLCCKACVRGVENAVSAIEGANAVADRDAGTVVLNANDKNTLRKAVNATLRAGFYGSPGDSTIKVRDISGAKDEQVKALTVTGVHLCCNGCVDAVEDALATVEGIEGTTAERKVESFQIKGNFNAKEVFAALNKAGFAGRVKK